jgi:hypothetical protein
MSNNEPVIQLEKIQQQNYVVDVDLIVEMASFLFSKVFAT